MSPAARPHCSGYAGAPVGIAALLRFVIDCSLDDRFNADNVIEKVNATGAKLGIIDRFLYRTQLIRDPRNHPPAKRADSVLLNDQVPAWGAGRVDTFNPYKAIQFIGDLKALPKEQLDRRRRFSFSVEPAAARRYAASLDGNNDSVDERNLSAALGAGVTPVTVDHPRLARVRNWIWKLAAAEISYSVDAVLAAEGRDIYAYYCASCHDFDGSQVGRVEPIGKSTPMRADSYTTTFAANQYTLYPDSKYRFVHFRKTTAMLTSPWTELARRLYLHNGSVPTLRDLLEPPEKRPADFFRGDDLYDRKKHRFVSNVPEANGQRFSNTKPRSRVMETAAISTAASFGRIRKMLWSSI